MINENELRQSIIDGCLTMSRSGLNRGASGNISLRMGDHMLITPSAIPYDQMTPNMIAKMPIDDESGAFEGPKNPSVEWPFHRDILRARPEMNAVVHTHARFSTILAVARKPIPAVHYMIAAFGGPDIRVADYATYGTSELSRNIINALEGRQGCLMANHGMVVCADTLTRALWLAHELEALADQYYHAELIGGAHILSDEEIERTTRSFASYGVQDGKPDTE